MHGHMNAKVINFFCDFFPKQFSLHNFSAIYVST